MWGHSNNKPHSCMYVAIHQNTIHINSPISYKLIHLNLYLHRSLSNIYIEARLSVIVTFSNSKMIAQHKSIFDEASVLYFSDEKHLI